MECPTSRMAILCTVAFAAVVIVVGRRTIDEETAALQDFFEVLDDNHDGHVDETEAKKYIGEQIGGHEFDSPHELTEAFQLMMTNMDQDATDFAKTITVTEVENHLQHLQQAVSVKEWVQHGLGLPQYAERFRENVITASDFPLLVKDDGNILAEELEISNRLHRNRIVREIKRLILGLGELPNAPQIVGCWRENDRKSVVHWRTPSDSGDPPVHKYVIEYLDTEAMGSGWSVIAVVEADMSQEQYRLPFEHPPGKHLFRIVAWTVYGRSPYATFKECQFQPKGLSERHGRKDEAGVKKSEEVEKSEMRLAGYWSLFVIGVTVALRFVTGHHVRIITCCLLYKLEKLARFLRLWSLADRLEKIERIECPCCSARHPPEVPQPKKKAPVLTRKNAVSHKIGPTQHFDLDHSNQSHSKSSPTLGDAHVEYDVGHWDSEKAVEALAKLPLPDYSIKGWDDQSSAPLTTNSVSSSSSDLLGGLIEGQCAFEGCQREWKGVFQLRNRWSRHFCSICLRTYCYEHTHISSHGPFGFCGQESSCVCETCFKRLPKATQCQLESTNKMDKSSAKRADLERGCCIRESLNSNRLISGIRKIGSRGTKIHPERHDSNKP